MLQSGLAWSIIGNVIYARRLCDTWLAWLAGVPPLMHTRSIQPQGSGSDDKVLLERRSPAEPTGSRKEIHHCESAMLAFAFCACHRAPPNSIIPLSCSPCRSPTNDNQLPNVSITRTRRGNTREGANIDLRQRYLY